jgi:hypothetical protein
MLDINSKLSTNNLKRRKMKKQNIIGILFVLSALFSSCTQTEFDAIAPSKLMGDSLIATTTIAQLESGIMTKIDLYTDTASKKAGLFTADLIRPDTTDLVINGLITSSDVEGNIYKYIIIQEQAPNGRALKISIDAGSLSGIYPLGQKVSVRLNGLYIGNYAQSPQIGTRFVNLDKFKTDPLHNVNIYRIEPGRIPLPIALKAIHAYGLPNIKAIKADTMTIAQIKATGASGINKLVCIKNAYFTGKGADYGLPTVIKDNELIFAPSTNGIGYPQSREIQDGTGSIFVATSEYAKFATYKLPPSSNRGNITAIVGWYNDKLAAVSPAIQTAEIYYQLTLRSIGDLGKGFESYHADINK